MIKKITSTFLLFLFIIPIISYGQITVAEKSLRTVNSDTVMGWKKGGLFAVNLSQTSLKNWASGGQNSIALNGILSYSANLKQERSAWDNSIDIGYGLLKQGSLGYRKTDDKIELNSKYGRKAFGNFYYAGLLNFRTQMQPGYNYINETTKIKISDLFSPAYLLMALGLDFKPNTYFSAFLAPVTAKITFVADEALSEAGAFGVTPGANSRSELGGYLRIVYSKSDFKDEFLKNVAFTTRLDLFSNYAHNPQNVDVSWETLIGLKVNKYIGVNFNTHLLYDDDIKVPVDDRMVGSKTQFKEILGVGFSYKF